MATIKDVAKKAGVSIATVSHVINETRYVSAETAGKVKQAMEELEYVQNAAAFSLRTQKTKTVGLLIPILKDEGDCIFFMQVALGVESVLKEKGYFTFLSNTNDDIEREMEEIKNFNHRQIDGLIMAPTIGDHAWMEPLVTNYPVVFVDRTPDGIEERDCIISDSETGCYEAISRLIQLGHRRIGIIGGEIGIFPNAAERFEGYKKALFENDLPIDPELVCEGEQSIETGYVQCLRLLEGKGVTSILVTSNLMAMGTMRALGERGIRVPDDISITVFDDYNWAKVSNPPLTVIRQQAYELGKKSAEILLKRIAQKSKMKRGRTYRLPTELVERDSWKQLGCPAEHRGNTI